MTIWEICAGSVQGAAVIDPEGDLAPEVLRGLDEADRNGLGPQVRAALDDQLPAMLDVQVQDVLLGAWARIGALREAADPEEHPADETVVVPMVAHEVASTHEAILEFTVDGRPMPHLSATFTVKLSLAVEGVLVVVRDRRARALRGGRARVVAGVYLGKLPVRQLKSAWAELPGELSLGPEGVAIG